MIEIKSLPKGAKQARGIAVVIDVFRTTSLIATMFACGCKEIVPKLTAEEAKQEALSDDILIGERIGRKLPGFHYNISPVELSAVDLKGKRVVISTTNGTRTLLAATGADEVVVGSFVNATAIANYIRGKEATLVPAGMLYGKMKAVEDEVCAEVLKKMAEGEEVDFSAERKRIENSISSKLRDVVQDQDIDFCLTLDKFDVVPKFVDGKIVT